MCLHIFQFMHPLWDATAKYSIHIPIYTIFCIYCVILSSFISFTQSYLSIHLPLLVRISQCFYVRLRFAPASYSSLVQKTYVSLLIVFACKVCSFFFSDICFSELLFSISSCMEQYPSLL